MILNREKGAPPLYSQVETILRTDIEHGKYNKGDSFPTENMLMEEYQVSRVTIRQPDSPVPGWLYHEQKGNRDGSYL